MMCPNPVFGSTVGLLAGTMNPFFSLDPPQRESLVLLSAFAQAAARLIVSS
jgi:hypothetical protein